MLNQGTIVAILLLMGFTSLTRWLKLKIKNRKIASRIPNGFILSILFGVPITFIFGKLKIFSAAAFSDNIWDFLSTWIIISALSGFGWIGGKKLMVFVKALIAGADINTELAKADIDEAKTTIEHRKDSIKVFKEIKKEKCSK
jgi:hypothetical protein